MSKIIRGVAGVIVAATLALTACSDPGTIPAASGPAPWPAQDGDLTGTTLTIWAAQNSSTVPESVVAGFEELTGAQVEVETIADPYEQGVQTRVATGDKPDLAFWQPTASQLTALNAAQNLQPLDDAPWLDAYDPALRDVTGILDDTRYAALISMPSVEGVYYNKRVFEQAGVTATPPTGTPSSRWPAGSGARASPRSSRWAATAGPPSGGCRCSWPTPPPTGCGTG